jgi:hypothetical protein
VSPFGTLSLDDHNQNGLTNTYGVALINSSNRISEIAS